MRDREREMDYQVFEQRLDAGVSELKGRGSPPDVTAAVMARLKEPVDGAGVAGGARPRSHPGLLAAGVLLGLGAVVATFWMTRVGDPGAAELRELRQDPQRIALRDMGYVVVSSSAELAKLPQDTLGVELRGLGFQGVDTLQKRLPYVRKLILRGEEVESAAVTRALWLRDLQLLDIVGCHNVKPNAIAELAQDPTLLQVVLGGQAWLEEPHLRQLGKAGIMPMLPPGHPQLDALAPALNKVHREFASRMRERRDAPGRTSIPYVVVRSQAEIEALDPGVVAVDGIDLDDVEVAALARLKNLRHLSLRAGLQARSPERLTDRAKFQSKTTDLNRGSVTDAGLAVLAELPRLETLLFAGTVDVKGDGLRHLGRLNVLRELRIVAQDTSDDGLAFLPHLSALRRLEIEANHGFGTAGMQAIAECKNLESLVLSRCPQLSAKDYAGIGALAGLRELRIRWPGNAKAWRDDSGRELTAAEMEVLRVAGLTGSRARHRDALAAALPRIVEARGLEVLEIAHAEVPLNLEAIGDLPNLQELTLVNIDAVTAELVDVLPSGLLRLDLSASHYLDDSAVSRISECFPRLELLHLNAVPNLRDLSALPTMTSLRRLEVRFCDGLGVEAGEALEQCTFLHWLDCTYCRNLHGDVSSHLREHGVAVKQQRW